MDLIISAGALGLVLLIAFGVLSLVRQVQMRTRDRVAELEQLDGLALGPRERLIVMKWRGEILLLGVTANAINLVHRQPAGTDDASRPRPFVPSADAVQRWAGILARPFDPHFGRTGRRPQKSSDGVRQAKPR
jgi:flagellar biogenesis protein FliO